MLTGVPSTVALYSLSSMQQSEQACQTSNQMVILFYLISPICFQFQLEYNPNTYFLKVLNAVTLGHRELSKEVVTLLSLYLLFFPPADCSPDPYVADCFSLFTLPFRVFVCSGGLLQVYVREKVSDNDTNFPNFLCVCCFIMSQFW